MNKKLIKSKFVLVCLIMLIVSAVVFHAHAQSSPYSVSVDISPANPAAGEKTTITLSSYAENLDSVMITWLVNGKKVSSQVGLKSLTVTAPAVGSETVVRALVSLPDGGIEKKVTIRPNVMVLLWQAADSYVPAFYRGKAMATDGSPIKVVAMPEVKSGPSIVSQNNLIYSWKLNYNNDAANSGYGKNYLIYTNDYLENSDNVSVDVSTVDGQYTSQASIDLSANQPHIVFYKNDPTQGIIWDQALKDGYKVQGNETLVAEPYFIAPKAIWDPSLVFNWSINGNPTNTSNSSKKNWLPIMVKSGSSGNSSISLEIESKDQFLETANKQINVQF